MVGESQDDTAEAGAAAALAVQRAVPAARQQTAARDMRWNLPVAISATLTLAGR
jgi:hypothetical protein